MPDDRKESGRIAEDAVADYLSGRGYAVIQRNYRKRWAEIDIVALKGHRLHFVEIKSRRTEAGPSPMECWADDQRTRFVKLADVFLAEHPELAQTEGLEVSLDYVSVKLSDDGSVLDIDYIEDAFHPD